MMCLNTVFYIEIFIYPQTFKKKEYLKRIILLGAKSIAVKIKSYSRTMHLEWLFYEEHSYDVTSIVNVVTIVYFYTFNHLMQHKIKANPCIRFTLYEILFDKYVLEYTGILRIITNI